MATLYKRPLRNGNWTYVIQYFDLTGIRRKRHLGQISLTLAKQIKKKLEVDIAEGKWNTFLSTQHRMTISELQAGVEKVKQNKIKQRTQYLYDNAFDHFIRVVGDVYVESVTKLTIIEFMNKLILEEKSPPTVNRIFRHLQAGFQVAVDYYKAIYDNPFDDLDQLNEGDRTPPVMPEKDIALFFLSFDLSNPEELKDYAYYHLLYRIGSRPEETYRLTWERVLLDHDIPHVIFEWDTTKGKKTNYVPIPKECVELFKQLPHTSDRPFDQMTYNSKPAQLMKRYLKRAKLPLKYTPYFLRHTLATNADANIQDISALYNHSDVKVTQKYTHLKQNLIRKQKVITDYPSVEFLQEKFANDPDYNLKRQIIQKPAN